MRNALALHRLVAAFIAVGMLVAGCGQTLRAAPGESPRVGPIASSNVPPSTAPATMQATMPAGTIYRNPASGRSEVVVDDVGRTAVLIGDSQSEPASSWPRMALAAQGYRVHFSGRGGTGFVSSSGTTGNYVEALLRGDWLLPYGSPPLVVIQGGGNDATRGATDEQISANAARLITCIRQRYPDARLVMVGTLARGAADGGGRRTEVDTLLGVVAGRHSIPFVSVGDWLTRYALTNSMTDGVHLAPEGHTALGLLLARRLDWLGLRATDPQPAAPDGR